MNKYFKIILWILSAALLLFILASAALPSWLSTPYGKETALQWVNGVVDGQLSVEKVHLSWFGKQRLENVQFTDKNGTLLFKTPYFETNTGLISFLFGSRTFKNTTLIEPFLLLKKESEKKNNFLPQFKGSLLVEKGQLLLQPQSGKPISFTNIQVTQSKDHTQFDVSGSSEFQNNTGTFQLHALLKPEMKTSLLIENFPMEAADILLKREDLAVAFGPTLNLEGELTREQNRSLTIKAKAHSVNLKAEIEGSTLNGMLHINPESHLEFTLTPTLFKQLIAEELRKNWDLASKTTLTLDIEKAILPLHSKNFFKNSTLQASAYLERVELHHGQVGSYSLKQFDISFMAAQELQVAFTGEMQGKEATHLSGHLSIGEDKTILFDYLCKGFPVTLLELVSPNAEEKVRQILGNRFDIEGSGSWIRNHLESSTQLTSSSSKQLLKITGGPIEYRFNLSGDYGIKGDKAKIIGDSIFYEFNGIGKLRHGTLSVPFLSGKFYNPFFEFDLRGQIGGEKTGLALDQLQLIGLGNIKDLPFESELPLPALKNGNISLQIDGAKNAIHATLESDAAELKLEIHNFIHNQTLVWEAADFDFDCELKEFPVLAISPFIHENLNLALFIGNTLNLKTKGTYTPTKEPRLNLDLTAEGSGFKTNLSLTINETLYVKQNEPSHIYWEMTPERYDALVMLAEFLPNQSPTFSLIRPAQLNLNITQFSCPTSPSQSLSDFLCQSGFIGDLQMSSLHFRSKVTDETISFQDICGSIQGANFSEAIDLALRGNISAANIPKTEHSSFLFTGQMLNLWTKSGRFNREGLTVKGELSLNLIPVRQVTGIMPLDHETREITRAVLGELVNARIYGEINQLTGPITIDIKSSNFKASLPLHLQPQALYLRDFVDAEISLTNAVNETLLKDINPLLITGVYSDHPLKLYIDPSGFLLPIRPYNLQNVQIGKAILDIGKVRVRNGGQLQSLLEFLKNNEINPDGTIEAWFTPIFISLKNGVGSYKRFDALLANNVHLALWGSVNLITNGVDMTLAIAPSTLYQRFKISGLTQKDMFQVKMKGTTDNLDIDWSSAYSRIAVIVAKNSGGLGNLVGGILEGLLPAESEPLPPPTTNPLPWESLYPSTPGDSIPKEAN